MYAITINHRIYLLINKIMDTLTAIKTRRSVRMYKEENLDTNLISEIVSY